MEPITRAHKGEWGLRHMKDAQTFFRCCDQESAFNVFPNEHLSKGFNQWIGRRQGWGPGDQTRAYYNYPISSLKVSDVSYGKNICDKNGTSDNEGL